MFAVTNRSDCFRNPADQRLLRTAKSLPSITSFTAAALQPRLSKGNFGVPKKENPSYPIGRIGGIDKNLLGTCARSGFGPLPGS